MATALTVVPASVELKSGETQAFEAKDKDGNLPDRVKWSLVPDGGLSADDTGVYTAPRRVFRARRIVVVARQLGPDNVELARGSATIDLDPSRTWIPLLGVGWVALFAVLLSGLLWWWPSLCPQCAPPGVFVSPPVVTLGPGQAQQFVANAAVSWTNTVNAAGLYVAPTSIDAEQLVTVTATSRSDPQQSAMGVVRLAPSAGLTVMPSSVTLTPGAEVKLTASITGANQVTPAWLQPPVGTISADGLYKAPSSGPPQAVVVLAQAQIPATATTPAATLLGGALVSLVPSTPGPCEVPGSTLWRLILLVAWVGALGGLTHAMGSFGTYVGNRDLKASWLWWYALKPALSAAVAVLVFLVFRAGLGAPDLGLEAADCLTVAGFAGLVGLFAEPATVKLKDIFDAIFTPRRDPREDKTGQGQSGPSPRPTITGIDAKGFKASEEFRLKINGQNFADGCTVQVGTESFVPNPRSASHLEVVIPASRFTPGQYDVRVFNKPPNGDGSLPEKIDVAA